MTLVILLALLAGFWRYSENLIETLDHQASLLRQNEEVLGIIGSKNTNLVRLSGIAPYVDAHGKLVIDTETGDIAVYVQGVPLTSLTERYCVWYASNAEVLRVAEFSHDDTTRANGAWNIGTLGRVQARSGSWSMTLEPGGNQPRPAGPVVLGGTAR
ncbi:MAG: hypothetical protein HY563_04215 [Ignavibacteriales bacterium]|nr:hypothetical protein [Ignavibacteriales bacterium]